MFHANPGARAVEVTALVGDSVVAVHHLTDPRRGRVSQATKVLFAAGALGLVVAFAAFFQGVSVAKANERAFHRWTEVEKLPAVEFRARRLGAALDVFSILGLVVGLGAITWGLARVARERRSPRVVAEGPQPFAVVEPRGDAFVMHRGPGLPEEPILPGTRVRFEHGIATWLVAEVPAPTDRVGGGSSFDDRVLAFAGGSLAVHAALLLALFAIPEDVSGLSRDDLGDDRRFVRVSTTPHEDAKKLEQIKPDKPGDAGEKAGAGAAAAGLEGKAGGKDKPAGQTTGKIADASPVKAISRHDAMNRARNAGILGVLASNPDALTSVNGEDLPTSGFDDEHLVGGLIGPEGESQGTGLGRFGDYFGGGGTNLRSIGSGKYATICSGGSCDGREAGYRGLKNGDGLRTGRKLGGPPKIGDPRVLAGGLDKSIIRRHVRQQLAKIQYCYEKELVVKPELDGTVDVQFTIDASGRVMAARANGVDDKVASCVASVIKDIDFPKPEGIVQVTSYPFHFRNPGAVAQK